MGQSGGALVIGEEIGRGAYGTVHKGTYQGKAVAVKKIHRLLLDYARNDPQDLERLTREFEGESDLLKTLTHPNVVQFVGAFQTRDERALVMELLHETLAHALARKKNFTERLSILISRDIARGLSFLHEQDPPLVHRDLNANNVLLTEDFTAKISDFGVSKFRPTDLDYLSTKAPGCFVYMPPEALADDPKYTEKLDVFSFGVLMLQMVTGEDPNPGIHGIGTVAEVERRKDHIEIVPGNHPLKGCILQSLENNPHNRPTVQDIISFLSWPIPSMIAEFDMRYLVAFLKKFKVCCIGGTGVGRTCLFTRYARGYCQSPTCTTVGVGHCTCTHHDFKVYLWELNGFAHSQNPILLEFYGRSTAGLIIVVDVMDLNSLERARSWKQSFDNAVAGRLPIPAILLANKCDLPWHREVSPEALAELSKELNCFSYMEVSARTGQNVKEAFTLLFESILQMFNKSCQTPATLSYSDSYEILQN